MDLTDGFDARSSGIDWLSIIDSDFNFLINYQNWDKILIPATVKI